MLGFWEALACRKQLSHCLGIIKRHINEFIDMDRTDPIEVMDCLPLYCCIPFSRRRRDYIKMYPSCEILLITRKSVVYPVSGPLCDKVYSTRGNVSSLTKRKRQEGHYIIYQRVNSPKRYNKFVNI